jgi:4a-hydroxytetrahydrobiopterin dehydratase
MKLDQSPMAGMAKTLSGTEIDAFLSSAQAGPCRWVVRDGKLCVSLEFPTFKEAFSFMTSVAMYAESRNHHPEWCNVYNRVEISLSTHDAGGITQKDIDQAVYITRIYPRYANLSDPR